MIPQFETERLILKGVTMQDSPAYLKHFVDYEVIRFLSDIVPWPYPEDGVEYYLKNVILPNQGKGKWMWGIYLKSNVGELIGAIELWKDGKPENRGFWLAKKHWGRGIMTEANYPILKYAFDALGFEKLIFANAVGNMASRRVKEKTRCTFIGVQPAKFVDPKLTEQELWELTKENWKKRK